ncbi:sel1 repeat family protein [Entomomonas asaccharolytica]|uniref:Sel1 repeat family protein n=1 Tax=Entomomonas asaccharolytica TaxID=2785331 RepID=A0A974RVQ8_9GAMM|nr:sel1 repeat family protein [Entomomonas asaccharolytica]QQP84350.1 sel1 repeat family protein [Entomomonas asaccharolytica]
MKKGIIYFCILFATTASTINVAFANRGLNEIRYALFKDPNADVMEDLTKLAKFGDRQSMLLLGNLLVQKNSMANSTDALELFKKAFAEGHGEIPALTAMARVLDNNTRLRKKQASYIKKSIQQYPLTRDPQTVTATLEVFVTYPNFINNKQAEKLIALYQSSCLAFCRPELYKAVLAEQQGNKVLALQLYEKAFFSDSRAVFRYYKLLGDKQDTLFPQYTRSLQDQVNSLPVTTVHSIASVLDTIFLTQRSLAILKARQTYEKNKHLTGLAWEQAKAQTEISRKQITEQATKDENEINFWLDNAIERNWVPAMVSKVNKMTSLPTNYTPEEALGLIERIAATQPQNAKALTVSVSMVSSWNTLNPPKSYELIQQLQQEQYPSANMLLSTLYSRGVLDEPDQHRALAILENEAKKGYPSAFYVIAGIYYQGRAICRDKAKAYAYVLLAYELGEFRASGLKKQLMNDMTKQEEQQGLSLYKQLAKEYQL